MTKFRNFLSGKKTYLTAAIGVLGAVIAFGDGQIDVTALVAAIWAAAQTCFIRVGITNEVQRTQGQ